MATAVRLARFGGLRVPSEVRRLRWGEIDWQHGRFTVASPKTEHHDGHDARIVPLFAELRPYLLDAFEEAEPGAEYCITRYRDPAANLRTQLKRIITRAGIKPWPKLWQNLRSTRETELVEHFPAHVVTAWLGNSEQVAARHYLQVTDEHFARAAASKALQNPMQQAAASSRTQSQESSGSRAEPAFCEAAQDNATPREDTEPQQMGPGGLEPPTSPLSGDLHHRSEL